MGKIDFVDLTKPATPPATEEAGQALLDDTSAVSTALASLVSDLESCGVHPGAIILSLVLVLNNKLVSEASEHELDICSKLVSSGETELHGLLIKARQLQVEGQAAKTEAVAEISETITKVKELTSGGKGFTTLWDEEQIAEVQCNDCDTKFMVNISTRENLVLHEDTLMNRCPQCGQGPK